MGVAAIPLPTVRKRAASGDRLVAELIGEILIGLESHAQSGADSGARITLQLIHEVVARVVRFAVPSRRERP